MTDEQRERGRGPWIGCFMVGVLLGLPAYVLSIGPAVWLFRHGYVPKWTGFIYAPIGLITNNFPPAGRLLHWYLEFWQ